MIRGKYFRNLLTVQIRSLMTVVITNLKTMIIMVTMMIIIMDWNIKPKFYMNLLAKGAEVISWTRTSKQVTISNWYYQDGHNKHLYQTRISQDLHVFDLIQCAVPCADTVTEWPLSLKFNVTFELFSNIISVTPLHGSAEYKHDLPNSDKTKLLLPSRVPLIIAFLIFKVCRLEVPPVTTLIFGLASTSHGTFNAIRLWPSTLVANRVKGNLQYLVVRQGGTCSETMRLSKSMCRMLLGCSIIHHHWHRLFIHVNFSHMLYRSTKNRS